MTNLAFLVEGDLEQKFIQESCPNTPVRRINCNGDDVSISAIAKRVGSLARLLHKRHNTIVICFDREGRSETVEEIRSELASLLRIESIEASVILGIADRCVESWILADPETFCKKAGVAGEIESFEGKKGDSGIRKYLDKRKYDKTIEGVAWLKASRPIEIAKRSPSFRQFLCDLQRIDCWWLKR